VNPSTETANSSTEEIKQYGTHNLLARQAGLDSFPLDRLRLDAIIVPASRPAPNLDQAITLARAANCWLLILCSRQLRGTDAVRQLATRSYRKAIVIDVPAGYSHDLFRFPRLSAIKAELPQERHLYSTDLSLKRNIGLVMARLLNWQHIFFLDDDIRDVSYPDLQSTVNMLGSYAAAGLWITEYPDNSVVCHANRITGGSQDVFVSGAALAVDSTAGIGFFPDVYNEDWLFFFDYAGEKRLANSGLEVTQLRYDPFAKPRRAAWQEFGDVLAEGLYTSLHPGPAVDVATADYWGHFLEARRSFLEEVATRAESGPLENLGQPVHRGQVVYSVKRALKCLQTIDPGLCARYVQLWREDLVGWRQQMAGIDEVSIEAALAKLRLAPAGRVCNVAGDLPRRDATGPAVTAGAVMLPRSETMNHMPGRTRALGLASSSRT
jgi:hypothetical protein